MRKRSGRKKVSGSLHKCSNQPATSSSSAEWPHVPPACLTPSPGSCAQLQPLRLALSDNLPPLRPPQLRKALAVESVRLSPSPLFFQERLDGLRPQGGKEPKKKYYTVYSLLPPFMYSTVKRAHGSARLCSAELCWDHLLKLSTALYRTTTAKHAHADTCRDVAVLPLL